MFGLGKCFNSGRCYYLGHNYYSSLLVPKAKKKYEKAVDITTLVRAAQNFKVFEKYWATKPERILSKLSFDSMITREPGHTSDENLDQIFDTS